MPRLTCSIALIALFCTGARADHDSGAPLSWHVLSAGLDESRVAVYREQTMFGIFDFACDLAPATAAEAPDDVVGLQPVFPRCARGRAVDRHL